MKRTLLKVHDIRIERSKNFSLVIKDLAFDAGSIICLAGPNGGGKTTFIECLAGLLAPVQGYVTVDNIPISKFIRKTKAVIGFIPDDEEWLIQELCTKEYLELLQKVYQDVGVSLPLMREQASYLAHALSFTAFDQQIGQLSHGNKKKVQCIAGLMHRPKVILLDELRNGLDPLAIIAVEHIIKQSAASGACVIAATHDLWWAERMADETILIIDGSIAVHGKTKEIVRKYSSIEELFVQTVHKQKAII